MHSEISFHPLFGFLIPIGVLVFGFVFFFVSSRRQTHPHWFHRGAPKLTFQRSMRTLPICVEAWSIDYRYGNHPAQTMTPALFSHLSKQCDLPTVYGYAGATAFDPSGYLYRKDGAPFTMADLLAVRFAFRLMECCRV